MEALPIALFWSAAAWCLLRRPPALMYLFFASMPFGAFAAVPTELTGGLTLTPTPLVAVLLIARQLAGARPLAWACDAALRRDGLLLLFGFWVVAGVATLFMPRFFAGTVTVVPVRAGALAETTALAPTPQNLSQLVYISISVLTVFSFARLLRDPALRRHAVGGLCLGAAMTVFTGVLDLASQFLPIGAALELFRTATYALLTDVEILDSKRVVGLMPEASSFGGLALAFLAALYFFRRAMPGGRLRDRVVPVLMAALLLLVWLSTSSAAYLGLGLFAAAMAADWAWRALASGRDPYLGRGLAGEFWLGAAVCCGALTVLLAMPGVLVPMREMVDLMVLQKSASDSFEERSMWTRVSLDALVATHGLGVGLGGTRASNFAVALASNAGLLGAACYVLFVLQCLLLRRAAPGDGQGRAFLSAIRWAYVAPLGTSLMVGTTPDFGLFNAFFYGFAVALGSAGRVRAPRRLAVRHAAGPAARPARSATARRAHAVA